MNHAYTMIILIKCQYLWREYKIKIKWVSSFYDFFLSIVRMFCYFRGYHAAKYAHKKDSKHPL